MKITGFWIAETAFFSPRSFFVARTARHALIIQFVQMQWRRAGSTAELAGACASSAVRMATLAELRQGIIVLCTQALHAQSAFQHRMRRTGSAF